MSGIRHIKGITMIEYSLIVAVAAAAILGMSVYIKRAVSGRWRQSVDTFGYGRQYDAPEMKIWGK
jgi:Flp pilus assembly pilin Flp